jgi:hypothetical protein
LPALRRNSAPFSKMNGSRNHIVIVFATTDASFPRADFESAKWGGLNLKNKEAIDDTNNCSRCCVGIQLCDGVQRGHPAGAGRTVLRPDDQGC